MGEVSGLKEFLWIVSVSTCLKFLLIPSYHSTDFEVHRHWLAITHSLPLKEWYVDETSEWTLDYPPFFAWFEWFLAIFASLVDPKIVDLTQGLNYTSDVVVVFHRSTVIVADCTLYLGLWKFCQGFSIEKKIVIYGSVIFSPGLLMVDHMHFQYNGFLLGILLLSLASLKNGKDFEGGIWFAVLVCFKHLFAVAGPVYFVYLLRHYCRGPSGLSNFFKLGFSVMSVIAAAFGPFIFYGQIGQVLKRLFPFGRGLCHAYWAPNVWAVYNTTDKVLAVILRKLGLEFETAKAGLTGGLVGDFSEYAVLPKITPSITGGLVLLALLPCLIQIWRRPRQSEVVRWVVYAFTSGFIFGWHVHEKACLHFVIPMSVIALENVEASGDFLFLSTVSYYSLFPLLFEVKEYPVKVLLLVIYTCGLAIYHSQYFKTLLLHNKVKVTGAKASESGVDFAEISEISCEPESNDYSRGPRLEILGPYRKFYLWGLVPVEVYGQFLHKLLFRDCLPFIPLLLVSVYCALGLLYAWAKQLTHMVPWVKQKVL